MRGKAVIIGVGALGLGFLAERMSTDYDLCMVDVDSKADILRRIVANRGFTLNVCGGDGISARRVEGYFEAIAADRAEERARLDLALREADLVLTATTRGVLDGVVGSIAPTLNDRAENVWLLFCENGLDIAAAYRPRFSSHVALVDTVMSRMCRFAEAEETAYEPLWRGSDVALVVEDYDLIPLDAGLCACGPFSSAFSLVSHEEFQCWEDIKLYIHNGLHAFVAYHAFLEDVKLFRDVPTWVREKARKVALEELVPAIVRTHACAQAKDVEQRALCLLERFFNPYFNDSIQRGVRGVAEKLAPGERLLGGVEYIRRAGIEPVGYASTVEAAREILSRQRVQLRTSGEFTNAIG